jgi:hypothetical protein
MPPTIVDANGLLQPTFMTTTYYLPTHTCLVCAIDDGGNPRRNGSHQNLADIAAHLLQPKHMNRLANARHLHPTVLAAQLAINPRGMLAAGQPIALHRCNVCCLDPTGTPRHLFGAMSTPTLAQHLGGGQHGRRVDDGRYGVWYALGVPLP